MLCSHKYVPKGWLVYYKTTTGYRVHYSIYSALYSIFANNHNEFWKIWTDIFPIMYFICQFILYMKIHKIDLKYGLYFGIISSRICSLIYHIFNCISLRLNQTLIYIDLIGVANMAFGSPYIFITVFDSDKHLLKYSVLLLFTYCITVYVYLYMFFKNIPYHKTHFISQCLIVSLGIIGNAPLFYMIYTQEYRYSEYEYASIVILFSYITFYLFNIPERFLCTGASDGKLWNSHVLWHIGVSVTQYLYLQT